MGMDFIANQVHKMERSPEILSTTAIAPALAHRLRTPLLRNQLEDREVQVEETPGNLYVRLRFPPGNDAWYQRQIETNPEAADWPISWSPGPPLTRPNVSVCHWRVSSDRRDPPSPSGSW